MANQSQDQPAAQRQPVSFGSRLVRLYQKIREPLAYILVILVAIGGLFQERALQYTAMFMLGTMLVRLLVGTHRRIDRVERKIERLPVGKRYYKNLSEASAVLVESARAAWKQDGYVSIKYIGMTMFNAWNSLEDALEQMIGTGIREVEVHVAMSGSAWLDKSRIRDTWTGRSADVNCEKIEVSAQRGWKVKVSRYNFMPCLHGCLINERYLLLGIARWEDQGMKAGDRMFEYLVGVDDHVALEKIDVFKSWFERCSGEADFIMTPHGVPENQPTSGATSPTNQALVSPGK